MNSMRFVTLKSPDPFNPNPIKIGAFECFHCHRETRVIVQAIEDAEARRWRERYEALLGQLNATLQECRMLHGDDPMRIYWEKKMIEIRDRFCGGET